MKPKNVKKYLVLWCSQGLEMGGHEDKYPVGHYVHYNESNCNAHSAPQSIVFMTPHFKALCGGGGRGKKEEKTDENSGHYVIASSRPPERRPQEHRTLVPIT